MSRVAALTLLVHAARGAATATSTFTVTLPTATETSTATLTLPSGTGTATVTDSVTLPTGTVSVTVTDTVTLPTVTQTFTATSSGTATRTSTLTATLPTLTASATFTLPTLTTTQSSTLTLPTATYTGTSTATLPTQSVTVTSTVTLPSVTGSSTVSIPTATRTGTSTFTVPSSSATETLSLPTASATTSATSTLPSYSPSGTFSLTIPSETGTRSLSTTETGSSTRTQTGTGTATWSKSETRSASATFSLLTMTASDTSTWTLPDATRTATKSSTATYTLASVTETGTSTFSETSTASLPTGTTTDTVSLPSLTPSFTLPTASYSVTTTLTATGTVTVSPGRTLTATFPTATASRTASFTLPSEGSTVSHSPTLSLPTLSVTLTLPSSTATATQTMPTQTGSESQTFTLLTDTTTISLPTTTPSATATTTLPSETLTMSGSDTLTLPSDTATASGTATASTTLPSTTVTPSLTASLPTLTGTRSDTVSVPTPSEPVTLTLPSVTSTATLPTVTETTTAAETLTASLPTSTPTRATQTLPTPTWSRTLSATMPTATSPITLTLPTESPTISLPTDTETASASLTESLTLPSATATESATDTDTFTLPSGGATLSETSTSTFTLPSTSGTLSRSNTETLTYSMPTDTTTVTLPSETYSASLPSGSATPTLPSASSSNSFSLPTGSVSATLPTLSQSSTFTLPTATPGGGTPSDTMTVPTDTKSISVTESLTEEVTATEEDTVTTTSTATFTIDGSARYGVELEPDPADYGGVYETGVHFRARLFLVSPIEHLRRDSHLRLNLSVGAAGVRLVDASMPCNESDPLYVHGVRLEMVDLVPRQNGTSAPPEPLFADEGWATLAAPWVDFRVCMRTCEFCEWQDGVNATVFNVTTPSVWWEPPDTYASALDGGYTAGAFVRYRIFTDPTAGLLSNLPNGFGDAAKLVLSGRLCLTDRAGELGYGGYARVAGDLDGLVDPFAVAGEMGTLYDRPPPSGALSAAANETYAWLQLPDLPNTNLAMCVRLAQRQRTLATGADWFEWRFVFKAGTGSGLTVKSAPPLRWVSSDTRRSTWGSVSVVSTTTSSTAGTPGEPYAIPSPQQLSVPAAHALCVITDGCAAISRPPSASSLPTTAVSDVYFHSVSAVDPTAAPGWLTYVHDDAAAGSSVDLRPAAIGGAALRLSGDCNADTPVAEGSDDLGAPGLPYDDSSSSRSGVALLRFPVVYARHHVCVLRHPGEPWLVVGGGVLVTRDGDANLTWSMNDTRALTLGALSIHSSRNDLSARPYAAGGVRMKLVLGGMPCTAPAVGAMQETEDLGVPEGGPSSVEPGKTAPGSDESGLSTVAAWIDVPPVHPYGYTVCVQRAPGYNWEVVTSPTDARLTPSTAHQLSVVWADRRVGSWSLILVSSAVPELVPVASELGGDQIALLGNSSTCVSNPQLVLSLLGAGSDPDVHVGSASATAGGIFVPANPAGGWRLCYRQWWRNWVDFGLWFTEGGLSLSFAVSTPYDSGSAALVGGVLHYFDFSELPGSSTPIDPGPGRDQFKLVYGAEGRCHRAAVPGTAVTTLTWYGLSTRATFTLPVTASRVRTAQVCYLSAQRSSWYQLGSVDIQPLEVGFRNTTPPVLQGTLELVLESRGRFTTGPGGDQVFLVPLTQICSNETRGGAVSTSAPLSPGAWIAQSRVRARMTISGGGIGDGSQLRVCWYESTTGVIYDIPNADDSSTRLTVHPAVLTASTLPGRYTAGANAMAGVEAENTVDALSVKVIGQSVHAGRDRFRIVPVASGASAPDCTDTSTPAAAEGDMLQGDGSSTIGSVKLRFAFPFDDGDYGVCYFHYDLWQWMFPAGVLAKFSVADPLLSFEYDDDSNTLTVTDRMTDTSGVSQGSLFPGGTVGYDGIVLQKLTDGDFCAPSAARVQYPTATSGVAVTTGNQAGAQLVLAGQLTAGVYRVCYNKTFSGPRSSLGVWLHVRDAVTWLHSMSLRLAAVDASLDVVSAAAATYNESDPLQLGDFLTVSVTHRRSRYGPLLPNSFGTVVAAPAGAVINALGSCSAARAVEYGWSAGGVRQQLTAGRASYELMAVLQCDSFGCPITFGTGPLVSPVLRLPTVAPDVTGMVFFPAPPRSPDTPANLRNPFPVGEWWNLTVAARGPTGGAAPAARGSAEVWTDLQGGQTEARCLVDPSIPSAAQGCSVIGIGTQGQPYRIALATGRADIQMRVLRQPQSGVVALTTALGGLTSAQTVRIQQARAASLRILSVYPDSGADGVPWYPANSTPFPAQTVVAAQGFALRESVRYTIAVEMVSQSGARVQHGPDASGVITVRTLNNTIGVTVYRAAAVEGVAQVSLVVLGVCGSLAVGFVPGAEAEGCTMRFSYGTATAVLVTPVRTDAEPSLRAFDTSPAIALRQWDVMIPLPPILLRAWNKHGFNRWATGVVVASARAAADGATAAPPDLLSYTPVRLQNGEANVTGAFFTRPCDSCSVSFFLLSEGAAVANTTVPGWRVSEGHLRLAVLSPANHSPVGTGEPLDMQLGAMTVNGSYVALHDYHTWVSVKSLGAPIRPANASDPSIVAVADGSWASKLRGGRVTMRMAFDRGCGGSGCEVEVRALPTRGTWSASAAPAALLQRHVVMVEDYRRVASLRLRSAGEGARLLDGAAPEAAGWFQMAAGSAAYFTVEALDRDGSPLVSGAAASADVSVSLTGSFGDVSADGNGTTFAVLPPEATRQAMVRGGAMFGVQFGGPCLRCNVTVSIVLPEVYGYAAPLLIHITVPPQGSRLSIAGAPMGPLMPKLWSSFFSVAVLSPGSAIDYASERLLTVAVSGNSPLLRSSISCETRASPCVVVNAASNRFTVTIPAVAPAVQIAARSQQQSGGGQVMLRLLGAAAGVSALLSVSSTALASASSTLSWAPAASPTRVVVYASPNPADPGGNLGYLHLTAKGHAADGALPTGWDIAAVGAAGELAAGLEYPLTVQAQDGSGRLSFGSSGPVRVRMAAARPGCGSGGSLFVDGARDPQRALPLEDGNRTFRVVVEEPCEGCTILVSHLGNASAPWDQRQAAVGPLNMRPAKINTAVVPQQDWQTKSPVWPVGESRSFELRTAHRSGALLHFLSRGAVSAEAVSEPAPSSLDGVRQGSQLAVSSRMDSGGRLHVTALRSCDRCAVRIVTRPTVEQLAEGLVSESFLLRHSGGGDVFVFRAEATRLRAAAGFDGMRARFTAVLSLEAVDSAGNTDLAFGADTAVTRSEGGGNGDGGRLTSLSGDTSLLYRSSEWRHGVLRAGLLWSRACFSCGLTAVAAAAGVRWQASFPVATQASHLELVGTMPAEMRDGDILNVTFRTVDVWGDLDISVAADAVSRMTGTLSPTQPESLYGTASPVEVLSLSGSGGILNASLQFTGVVWKGTLSLTLGLRTGRDMVLSGGYGVTMLPAVNAARVLALIGSNRLSIPPDTALTLQVGCVPGALTSSAGPPVDSSCGGPLVGSGVGVVQIGTSVIVNGIGSVTLAFVGGQSSGAVTRTVTLSTPAAPAGSVQVPIEVVRVNALSLRVSTLPTVVAVGVEFNVSFALADINGITDASVSGFDAVVTVFRTHENGTQYAAEQAQAPFAAGAAMVGLTLAAVCAACSVAVGTQGAAQTALQDRVNTDVRPSVTQLVEAVNATVVLTLPASETSLSAVDMLRELVVVAPDLFPALHTDTEYTVGVDVLDSNGRAVDGAEGEVCLTLATEGPVVAAVEPPVIAPGPLVCGELAAGTAQLRVNLPHSTAAAALRLDALHSAAPDVQGRSRRFVAVRHAAAVHLPDPPTEWVVRRPLLVRATPTTADGTPAGLLDLGGGLLHPRLYASLSSLSGTIRPTQGLPDLVVSAGRGGWQWEITAPFPGSVDLTVLPPPGFGAIGGRPRATRMVVRKPARLTATAAAPASLLGSRPLSLAATSGGLALSLSVELVDDGGAVVGGDSTSLVELSADSAPAIPGALTPQTQLSRLDAGRSSFSLVVALPATEIATELRVRLLAVVVSPEAGNFTLRVPDFTVTSGGTAPAPVESELLRLQVAAFASVADFRVSVFSALISSAARLQSSAVAVSRVCKWDGTSCVSGKDLAAGRRVSALQSQSGVQVDFRLRVSVADAVLGQTVGDALQSALSNLDAALAEAAASCAAGNCVGDLATSLEPVGGLTAVGRRPTVTETLPLSPMEAGGGGAHHGAAPKGWYWEDAEPAEAPRALAPVMPLSGAARACAHLVQASFAAAVSTGVVLLWGGRSILG